MNDYSIVLTALFLRMRTGDAVLAKRYWPEVLGLLRREEADAVSAAAKFRRAGWWEAATLLELSDRVDHADHLVRRGLVQTIVDEGYPRRWAQSLGRAAPAAIWVKGHGAVSPRSGSAAVVGSRRVSDEVWNFAYEAGQAAACQGMLLVSGGAAGCDMGAERGALSRHGSVLRIIATGIDLAEVPRTGVRVVSVCAPQEIFSTAAAMERNALIYAAAERALVVEGRFRVGGTWHGASGALRRRLTTFYHRNSAEAWANALKAMGSTPVQEPGEFLQGPTRPEEPTLLPRADALPFIGV
jgi:hypothetical protein